MLQRPLGAWTHFLCFSQYYWSGANPGSEKTHTEMTAISEGPEMFRTRHSEKEKRNTHSL